MTENNWIPDPNAAQQVPPAYPAVDTQYNPNLYAPQMYVQPPKQTNGLAIAGFVTTMLAIVSFLVLYMVDEEAAGLSFLAACLFTIVGLVLSIVGVSMSKQRNSGLGLAVTGLVLSTVLLIILIISIVIAVLYYV